MTREEMKCRLKAFAIRIIKMVNEMPDTIAGNAIARQVIRSGTSPSANYRAACVGKSDRDFLNKLKMCEEELDETSHWLELIMESEMLPKNRMASLYEENLELVKIIVASIKTMRNKINQNE
ncbi:MAG: four helix bundle protein [Prevotella sp.]|nr:four helix bundle protein [Prevotella sp.]